MTVRLHGPGVIGASARCRWRPAGHHGSLLAASGGEDGFPAVAGPGAADQPAISWFELAWLAAHERIIVTIPVRSWLEQLADGLQTLG
jgi:hypothetical protein